MKFAHPAGRAALRLTPLRIDQRPSDDTDEPPNTDTVRFPTATLEQNVPPTISTRVFPPQIHPTHPEPLLLTYNRTDGCRKEACPDRQEAHCAVQASPE